ncbi:unnamed protein product [Symbiodinium pilosum]|uniref:Uncharacterized protein n=1 Tax=Symbiodinium pilosum TaxID=2952 RepID=A0A812U9B8_SYMPI|nr:unnamed protein product [Symbiodinium pilosum]
MQSQYAPFAQLPPPAGLVGTRSEPVVLPAALSDSKASAEQDAQKIFKLAREVVTDHDKWLSTLREEEANRKERKDLLRVVAQTSGPVEATLNFEMPNGAQATEKLNVEATTAFELYTKAYELLVNKDTLWKITVSGPTAGSASPISVQVKEAMYGQSLASLGLKAGCSYAVKIVQ